MYVRGRQFGFTTMTIVKSDRERKMVREPPTRKQPLKCFTDFLWGDHEGRSRLAQWFVGELRVFYFVVRGFIEHQCLLQASALTFVTLLSIVPLLALGFALMNYLGVLPKRPAAVQSYQTQSAPSSPRFVPGIQPRDQTATSGTATARPTTPTAEVRKPSPPVPAPASSAISTQTAAAKSLPDVRGPSAGATSGSIALERSFVELLLDSLTEQLTANQTEVRDRIMAYVRNTDFSALTAVGVIILILTAISALSTMEHVFNQIWSLRRSRTILRKITDYLSIVVICPLLLMAAMAMTPVISRNALVNRLLQTGYLNEALTWSFKLVPYVSIWLALALLYVFLPNTRVKLRCALAGGFAAGVIWQLAFWGYARFQTGMVRYNIIYSTLAALPFFLSWLYVSWLIVLFGAEVAAAYQNIESYSRARIAPRISPAERLRIGLNLLLTICARFRREEPPWTADQLSRYLECPARLVDELLTDLTNAKIIMPAGTGRIPAYQPAVPLNNISPARVIEALHETDSAGVLGTATPEAICSRSLMDQWHEGLWRELGNVGFDVLVEGLDVDIMAAARSRGKKV